MEAWEQQLAEDQKRELERQLNMIRRGTADIIPEEALARKIASSIVTGKPLKVKLGLDPSAPDIHIGHTVVLHKLRQFQELGHEVQLVIGDFTGRIGDPTGKSETRKQLSEEDVKQNAATYEKQLCKLLDPQKTRFYFNSAWLQKLNFEDALQLAGKVTMARMMERDDFAKRYANHQSIHVHEFFYPLMQGFDSVSLESDIELGGTDQTFNILMGRTLQGAFGMNDSQVAILMPILEGLDGSRKMSKSLGNYIGIDDSPNEMFGKAMSMSDDLMIKYFELSTAISNEDLVMLKNGIENGNIHPRDAKIRLAKEYVRMYHGGQAAEEAEKHFAAVFRNRSLPEEIEEFLLGRELLNDEGSIPAGKLPVVLGFVSSNSEARRSVMQGAVRINGQKLSDPYEPVQIQHGDIVQSGKRKFVKIVIGECR